MKKLLLACSLALPVSAAAAPSAAAFEFNGGGGFNWYYTFGIHCHSAPRGCDSAGLGGYGNPWDTGYWWGGSCGTGYCDNGFATATYDWSAVPGYTQTPAQIAGYPTPANAGYGFQPVGYTAAPAYWYGR